MEDGHMIIQNSAIHYGPRAHGKMDTSSNRFDKKRSVATIGKNGRIYRIPNEKSIVYHIGTEKKNSRVQPHFPISLHIASNKTTEDSEGYHKLKLKIQAKEKNTYNQQICIIVINRQLYNQLMFSTSASA
jgi:hypothetical protein